jgi:hypothetical protein
MGQTNTINEMHLQNSIIPVGPLGDVKINIKIVN